MIKTFADTVTARVFDDKTSKGIASNLVRPAQRRLHQLNGAGSIEDLRLPPGNQLEVLKGDRAGQYSIRINSQWRICFRWANGDAFDVEITDYH